MDLLAHTFRKHKNQIIFLVFFVLLAGLYFLVDPSESSYFPQCPLKVMTGYECAGCGVQRSFHELLHFGFLEAFKFNPLFVFAIIVFLMIFAFQFSKKEKLKLRIDRFIGGKAFIFGLLIIVFVFSWLKNTDFYKDFILNL